MWKIHCHRQHANQLTLIQHHFTSHNRQTFRKRYISEIIRTFNWFACQNHAIAEQKRKKPSKQPSVQERREKKRAKNESSKSKSVENVFTANRLQIWNSSGDLAKYPKKGISWELSRSDITPCDLPRAAHLTICSLASDKHYQTNLYAASVIIPYSLGTTQDRSIPLKPHNNHEYEIPTQFCTAQNMAVAWIEFGCAQTIVEQFVWTHNIMPIWAWIVRAYSIFFRCLTSER